MDTHRYPTTGHHPGASAGAHPEIGRLMAHLEQRLAELDRLHREMAEDAQALALLGPEHRSMGNIVGGRELLPWISSLRGAKVNKATARQIIAELEEHRRRVHPVRKLPIAATPGFGDQLAPLDDPAARQSARIIATHQ